MELYADLDENGIAYSVKEVTDGYINLGNSVPINSLDNELLGRKHKGGGEFYPRLTISADKTQIASDGVDVSTITVNIEDTTNSHAINFIVNNGTPVTVNTSNGVAVFRLTTTLTGDYTVTAMSDIYSTNSITVKGV